ncbi:hypothetical protein D3C86_876000 [compost metagenome]
MGGGDRRSCPGRDIDEKAGGEKRRQHRPGKGGPVGDGLDVDDAAGNGLHDIAAGDQCPGNLADGGDDERNGKRHGLGADRRADIVRHVVRADIDGHIGADGDGGDDDDGTRGARDESACEDSRENNEHEPRAKAGKLLRDVQRRLFDTGELVEILVERRLHV